MTKKKPNKIYVPGLILVGTFSKYVVILILPQWKKDVRNVGGGLMEGFKKMGCYDKSVEHIPGTIYSNSESALKRERTSSI